MSGRRTTEIKIRVTPDEKARWQQLAEEKGDTLSTLIRATVNREVLHGIADQVHTRLATLEEEAAWKEQNLRLDGTSLVGNAIELLAPCRGEGMEDVPLCPPCVEAGGCKLPIVPIVGAQTPPGLCIITNLTDAAPQKVVGTTDEVGANECLDPEVCSFPSGRCVEPSRCSHPASANVKPDWTFEARNA